MKEADKIFEMFEKNFEKLPKLVQWIFLTACTLLVLIKVIKATFEEIEGIKLPKGIKNAGTWLIAYGRVFLRKLPSTIDDPILLPKLKPIIFFIASVGAYVNAILFILWAFAIGCLISYNHIKPGFFCHACAWMTMLAFVYFALFFNAQGGQMLIILKSKKWK